MQVKEIKEMFPGFEQIAEHMPGGFLIYRADEQEEFLYVNAMTLGLCGCETMEEFKELTGNRFHGLIHPDDVAEVDRSIKMQISNSEQKLDYVKYRIVKKDGSFCWVEDYGHRVQDSALGDVFIVFLNDITEQYLMEQEALREREIIEGLSADFVSIFLIDLGSGTIRPYRTGKRYFTQSNGREIRSRETYAWDNIFLNYATRFVEQEDRKKYLDEVSLDRIRERSAKEESYFVHYRQLESAGVVRHMVMSIKRIESNSLSNHIVMGYRDETSSVESIQQETEHRLKIAAALEREKRANEAKNAFLFNISHDIRTPMNSIMGFTELAKRHVHEPELLKDYLSKVDVSNQHMMALIDDLLEMSQIDTGRTQIKLGVCRLGSHIQAVVDMLRPQFDVKNVKLNVDLKIPDEDVYMDPLRFRRVLINILSNAVKFTPATGTVTLTAVPKHISKSGYARYVITVQDTGIGMSEEFLGRIFEAFEREETSTQTGYIGTGLGLTITKRLLDIMGGSISVESEKGEGSTFTVSLPLKLVQEGEVETSAQPVLAPKGAAHGRILLVEDIEINRLLAETILHEAGFVVESVPDGCDAVEAVAKKPEYYYDLVLMDIQMPVMNGYEAARVIRSMGRTDTDQLPIIALSANARDEDRAMSIESGMNSHIAKPFDVEQLIKTINEFIQVRKEVS